jgi:predicted DNA-binding transcriptional regulator AlpA
MSAETPLNREAQAVAFCQASPPALLTLALIRKHYVPAGERTLHRWISAGAFPKPDIAFGGKVRWWKRETIEAWITAQTEGGSRE